MPEQPAHPRSDDPEGPSGRPRVAILLATHNGAEFLDEQLSSIAGQTFGDWILVASDDGSSDGTNEALQRFADAHPGRTIILPAARFGSAAANFFRLLRDAPRSDYYVFSDQDDVWFPDKLETLVGTASDTSEQRGGVLVHADLVVTDASLTPVADSFMRQIRADPSTASFGSLLVENYIPGSTMLIDDALVAAHLHDLPAAGDVVMHDWWISLTARAFGEIRYVPVPLGYYRQHETNVAGTAERSGIRFTLRKLATARSRTHDALVRQARAFAEIHGDTLPAHIEPVLATFLRFPDMNKGQRMLASIRLGILKQTLSRRVFQLLTV